MTESLFPDGKESGHSVANASVYKRKRVDWVDGYGIRSKNIISW